MCGGQTRSVRCSVSAKLWPPAPGKARLMRGGSHAAVDLDILLVLLLACGGFVCRRYGYGSLTPAGIILIILLILLILLVTGRL